MVIGLTYWFIQTSLAPVPVPPAPPTRGAVRFDPALDVSKSDTFFRLRPMGPFEVKPENLGRVNPFVPIPHVTTTASGTVEMVSSTLFTNP